MAAGQPLSASHSLQPRGLQHTQLLSFTTSWNSLRLLSTESVMPSNRLTLCCPLLWSSVFPNIRVFPDESALCLGWPKYRSISISPSNEYLELISFRLDRCDLPAVQRTLKSLLKEVDGNHPGSWTENLELLQLGSQDMTDSAFLCPQLVKATSTLLTNMVFSFKLNRVPIHRLK